MQGTHFLIPIYIGGTLSANHQFQFQAPFDMQLVKVSAVCDNATSFILDIGIATNTDLYLDAKTVTGAADTCTEYDEDDFVDAVNPHIAAGAVFTVDVDYDGGAGNDAAGVSIVLTFTEG
jgi:hypothetical protein